jgi:hypothetical protein
MITRGHCRGCRRVERFRHAGLAGDGSENGVRPRAVYRTCMNCGLKVLTLADVIDAEGLIRNVLAQNGRRMAADGFVVNGVEVKGKIGQVEAVDAFAFLWQAVWRLYGSWRPDGLSFLSYASFWLPKKLAQFISVESGEASIHRVTPKPRSDQTPLDDAHGVGIGADHAFAVALASTGRLDTGRLVAALDGREADSADDRLGDLRRLLADGDRRGVRRPDARGRSQAPQAP